MIHLTFNDPLLNGYTTSKNQNSVNQLRYYIPTHKYPSQVLTTPIILLKKILFSDYFSEQDDATDAEQEGKGELRPVESEHRIGPPPPPLVAAWVRVLCAIVGMHLCCVAKKFQFQLLEAALRAT